MTNFIRGLVVASIVATLAMIIVPNYIRSHTTASMHSCYFNQMWIEQAKVQWARDHHKADTDEPTEAELLVAMQHTTPMWCGVEFPSYQKITAMPTCFLSGEKYILGSLSQRVQCPTVRGMGAHGTSTGHAWGTADLNDEILRQTYRNRK